jgi:hypothetical protein
VDEAAFQKAYAYINDPQVSQADKDAYFGSPAGQDFTREWHSRVPRPASESASDISPAHTVQITAAPPAIQSYDPSWPAAETRADPVARVRASWDFEEPKNGWQKYAQNVLVEISVVYNRGIGNLGDLAPYIGPVVQGVPEKVTGVVDSMLAVASTIYPDSEVLKKALYGTLGYSSAKIAYEAFVDLAQGNLRQNSVTRLGHLAGNVTNIAGVATKIPVLPMVGGVLHTAADSVGGFVHDMVQAHRDVMADRAASRRGAVAGLETGRNISPGKAGKLPYDAHAGGSLGGGSSSGAHQQPSQPLAEQMRSKKVKLRTS